MSNTEKQSLNIELRPTIPTDLDAFFHHQADEEAQFMAAFTSENATDQAAYLSKWSLLLKHPTVHMQTIVFEEQVVGCVVKFEIDGEAEITYALNKVHWGKGWMSQAVQDFLKIETSRPLHGRVAFDNVGSLKILEKAGFQRIGEAVSFAYARGKKIKEFIYRLDE